jgi:hypothetical protein
MHKSQDVYDLGLQQNVQLLNLDTSSFCEDELEALRSIYNGLIEKLFEQAQDTNSNFYSEWKPANSLAIQKNLKMGSVNSYVRMKDGPYLEISWKCQQGGFRNNKTGESEKKHPDYISRGKGFAYSDKKLQKYCQPWEWPIVQKYEVIFSKIRLAYSGITESRKRLGPTKNRLIDLQSILKELQL